MQSLPSDLTQAACDARERLGALARRTAANGSTGGFSAGTQMAAVARAAIFADALLSAAHARLQELKNVAR